MRIQKAGKSIKAPPGSLQPGFLETREFSIGLKEKVTFEP